MNSQNNPQSTSGNGKLCRISSLLGAALLAGVALVPMAGQAQQPTRPNIVVIWGDDVGYWDTSAYNRGVMGYRTPNLDRIAKEGALFTDHYAQPSCTAGRAAFITGQLPIRSGMTTVGSVGSPQGLKFETVTLAEVLKQQGYATGQFGKNHLGDRNEHLPTVHGFDEFYGNLYHLNTEEEPEDVDYPTDPAFRAAHGARGVLHCYATSADQPGGDSRFGKWGKQRCEDTGPLTIKRMERVDEDFINSSFKFMDKSVAEGKPFFIWLATSRMHAFTHTPKEYLDKCKQFTSGEDKHCAGMLQHDHDVGVLLKKLDQMGVAGNTIVVYSADNGPEHNTYPDGGTTPFRGEKMTTYEGGLRVPMLVRWPGHVPAGSELNGIQTHEDVFTTLATAAGVTDVRERAAQGDKFGTDTVKRNYIDGVNNLDYWSGKSDYSNRNFVLYYSESRLQALRVNQWKWHFYTRECYFCPTAKMEMAKMFNVRQDPFESYESAQGMRQNMQMHKQGLYHLGVEVITEHLRTLKEYPPVQKGGSLSVGEVMEQILNQNGN